MSQSETVTKQNNNKIGANSFQGICMIIIGTIMYGIAGVLTKLSMLDRRSIKYNTFAAMVVCEFGKFIISFILLFYLQNDINDTIKSIKSISFTDFILFSFPAFIYSINNNLNLITVQYMDPGSMQILIQFKIITTALLWWCWFKKNIDKQQWISLIMLCFGSMLVALPHDINHINHPQDIINNNNNNNEMYVIWPFGPIFILIQVSLSPIAGIYTEWMLKNKGESRSIFVDSLLMYFWGIITNLFQFFYHNNNHKIKIFFFQGFNYWTWLTIFVYIIGGLCIAFVIKYFSNITKLFMFALSIIISGLLTFIIFNLKWTLSYLSGLPIVLSAVLLYKSPKKFI